MCSGAERLDQLGLGGPEFHAANLDTGRGGEDYWILMLITSIIHARTYMHKVVQRPFGVRVRCPHTSARPGLEAPIRLGRDSTVLADIPTPQSTGFTLK